MPVTVSSLFTAVEQLRGKQAFLFDMDGLLFDTERLFMEQHADVMKVYGYTLTREVYVQTLGLNGSLLLDFMRAEYGEDYPFWEINRQTGKRVRAAVDTEGIPVMPEIPEVLQYLKEQGIPCAVASSSSSTTVRHYLEISGLDGYFQEIVGGEMVERSKPEPDIFLLACERMGQKPEDCVVLEDSENGVRAAVKAGCTVICVPDMKQPSKETMKWVDYLVERK